MDPNGRSALFPNRRGRQKPKVAIHEPTPGSDTTPPAPTIYRVVGEGPQAAEPIELVALTATEAEAHCSKLRRLCGRAGKVEVWGKGGTKVSPARLRRLALAEAAGTPPPDNTQK